MVWWFWAGMAIGVIGIALMIGALFGGRTFVFHGMRRSRAGAERARVNRQREKDDI